MKLHYLANLFATKHYVGSALGLGIDLYSRRLQLNQAEAAKRVDDAVKVAMSSVDKGEVDGVALPLNYVALSSAGTQQLTVNLRLPGVDRNQKIMIDTGSSSLAFCNKSFAEEANISKVNYAQCNTYGFPDKCPDGSIGASEFYVGQVYQGDVGVYNDQGDEVASIDNVSFAILDAVQDYMCAGPLDGIVGVAFNELKTVVAKPSLDFDAMSLWNESCKNPDPVGRCAFGNITQTTLPSPLETALAQDIESGYNKVEAFGIYVDYAVTIGSKKDTVVPSLGIYFRGNLALNNQFYNNGNVQVAKQPSCDGENEWYQLQFNAIRVPGLNFTADTTELCQESCVDEAKCYTDSGNSWIQLPLSEEFCNPLPSDVDKLKSLGSLYIDLDGADGGNVTLSLPLLWLWEQAQAALGYIECVGESGPFVLGFPIFQYYYLAYDMGNHTVTFVELELSNETENFIDGPELGGTASTSAGYLLYQTLTTGILVLTASCILRK